MIYRTNRDEFSVLDRSILLNPKLSLEALGLYWLICDADDHVPLNDKELIKLSRKNKHTFTKAVKELLDEGIISFDGNGLI